MRRGKKGLDSLLSTCKKEEENEKTFKVCSKVSSWAKLPLSVHNVIEQSYNKSRSELFPREREREREHKPSSARCIPDVRFFSRNENMPEEALYTPYKTHKETQRNIEHMELQIHHQRKHYCYLQL
jgi:hypothetical protein